MGSAATSETWSMCGSLDYACSSRVFSFGASTFTQNDTSEIRSEQSGNPLVLEKIPLKNARFFRILCRYLHFLLNAVAIDFF